jgi:hypothetical protein
VSRAAKQRLFDGEGSIVGAVPLPEWAREPLTWHYTLDDLRNVAGRLADLGQAGDESALVAARILAALGACLEKPRERRAKLDVAKMNEAARLLEAQAGVEPKYPARVGQLNRAEDELARVVGNALADGADDERIARYLEAGRVLYAHLGTHKILPHDGTEQERRAVFVRVVFRLRSSTEEGQLRDPAAVVAACARALGCKRRLFEAQRKRERREDLRA